MNNEQSQYKLFDIKYFLFSTILFSVNILVVNNDIISILIGVIELSICLLFINNLKYFLIICVLFITSCFDIAPYVTGEFFTQKTDHVYSILYLPFLKVYGFYFVSILPIFHILNKNGFGWIKHVKKYSRYLYFLLCFLFAMPVIGISAGFFGFFVNDNNLFLHKEFFARYFFRDSLSFALVCLYSGYFIYMLVIDRTFHIKLQRLLFSILLAIIICSIFSAVSSHRGFYGRHAILLMPTTLFYSIFVLLFLFYKDYKKYRIILSLFSIIAVWIQFTQSNAMSGKSWIVFFYVFLIIFLILLKTKRIWIILLFSASIYFLLPLFINIFSNKQEEVDVSSGKLNEAIKAISFINSKGYNWYDLLPDSPKTRIEEFLNIFLEYTKKPYFAMLGKGYGGSIEDHLNTFHNRAGAFNDEQHNYQTFVVLHESVNTIFLKFGLLGLVSMILVYFKSLSNAEKNPWIVIGSIWMLFFFTYSIALGLFGIPSLILGFYLLGKYKNLPRPYK